MSLLNVGETTIIVSHSRVTAIELLTYLSFLSELRMLSMTKALAMN